MSIVTPIAVSFGYPTSHVGTDAARRDNVQREIIPALVQGEKSAAEKGVAKEGERAAQNPFTQPTYDKPSVQQELANSSQSAQQEKDNGRDESAGKQDSQDKQEQQQQRREVDELKTRDAEVRQHEQAHAAVGGQYAGSPQYEYETGPDGQRYAVAGEVSIDVAEANSPQATIDKMQQVKAAALAPAEPSAQDYKVATQASQNEMMARAELAKQNAGASDETDSSLGPADRQTLEDQQSESQGPEVQQAKAIISGFYARATQPSDLNLSLFA